MLGYTINPQNVKLIQSVNFIKEEYTDTICNIYINATMNYGVDNYYLIGRIYKDYKAQGNYTYINGKEREYKTVKPVLNAINKYASTNNILGVAMDKILIYAGLKKDIKETRIYKKLMAEQTAKENNINDSIEEVENKTTIENNNTIDTTMLTDEQKKQLECKIQRAIKSESFEMVMLDMGYKTLEELDRDKNNKSTIGMYFTKREEFDGKVKQHVELLKNDSKFIDNIKQTFIDGIKEINKTKEYEAKVWIADDNDLTLDELKYKYANDIIAEDKYKELHKDDIIESNNKLSLPQGYTLLKESDNIKIIGKIESYTSHLYNETYDIVTDLQIIKDDSILYEAYRIDFPVNSEGKISIVNYLDDIILYITHTNVDPYWITIQLDKLLKGKTTITFEIMIKNLKSNIVEQTRIKEYEQNRKELNELKEDIINLANSKNILACIGYAEIRLLKNIPVNQHSHDFIKYVLEMDINDNLLKPYLLKQLTYTNYNSIDKDILLQAKEYVQEYKN